MHGQTWAYTHITWIYAHTLALMHLYITNATYTGHTQCSTIEGHSWSEQQWQRLTNITNTSICLQIYIKCMTSYVYNQNTIHETAVDTKRCDLCNLQGICAVLRATSAASRLKDAGKDLIVQLHTKLGGPKNADITRGTLQTNSAQNCCGRSHNCQ